MRVGPATVPAGLTKTASKKGPLFYAENVYAGADPYYHSDINPNSQKGTEMAESTETREDLEIALAKATENIKTAMSLGLGWMAQAIRSDRRRIAQKLAAL